MSVKSPCVSNEFQKKANGFGLSKHFMSFCVFKQIQFYLASGTYFSCEGYEKINEESLKFRVKIHWESKNPLYYWAEDFWLASKRVLGFWADTSEERVRNSSNVWFNCWERIRETLKKGDEERFFVSVLVWLNEKSFFSGARSNYNESFAIRDPL